MTIVTIVTTRAKCGYANKYKDLRKPTCGCEACKEIWESKNPRKLEKVIKGSLKTPPVEIPHTKPSDLYLSARSIQEGLKTSKGTEGSVELWELPC